VSVERCPKSSITAESQGWLEEYGIWRRLGSPELKELAARQVEAFLVLEGEFQKEGKHERE
jgi:hypothetical protein